MQIGFSIDNKRRFLTYVKKLDLKYKDRIIVLSLVSKGSLKLKKIIAQRFHYKKNYYLIIKKHFNMMILLFIR